MDSLNYNSVENQLGFKARASFTVNTASVFKEEVDIVPTIVDDAYLARGTAIIRCIDLVEKDETLAATCQVFNAKSVLWQSLAAKYASSS